MKKLLKKLKSYLNKEAEQLQHEDEGLSKVLKKLKKEKKLLKEMIVTETDPDKIEMLEIKLNVIHLQRKKGITLLSTVRKKGNQ